MYEKRFIFEWQIPSQFIETKHFPEFVFYMFAKCHGYLVNSNPAVTVKSVNFESNGLYIKDMFNLMASLNQAAREFYIKSFDNAVEVTANNLENVIGFSPNLSIEQLISLKIERIKSNCIIATSLKKEIAKALPDYKEIVLQVQEQVKHNYQAMINVLGAETLLFFNDINAETL